MMIEQIARSMV